MKSCDVVYNWAWHLTCQGWYKNRFCCFYCRQWLLFSLQCIFLCPLKFSKYFIFLALKLKINLINVDFEDEKAWPVNFIITNCDFTDKVMIFGIFLGSGYFICPSSSQHILFIPVTLSREFPLLFLPWYEMHWFSLHTSVILWLLYQRNAWKTVQPVKKE